MALHNIGSLVRTYASVHLAAGIPNFYRSEYRLGRPGLGLQIDPAYMQEHTPKGEDWG